MKLSDTRSADKKFQTNLVMACGVELTLARSVVRLLRLLSCSLWLGCGLCGIAGAQASSQSESQINRPEVSVKPLGRVVQLPSRGSVTVSLYWHPVAEAKASLLLFPGGDGGFGAMDDSSLPTGRNFLVRTVPLWLARGFNVAIFGQPDDHADLDYAYRTTPDHLSDIGQVIAYVKQQSPAPLWLVGTSRGTISATAAAIRWQELGLAGLVVSSSIVAADKPGNLPSQNLAELRLPVLLAHHRQDQCPVCRPEDVAQMLTRLEGTATKALLWFEGGGPPTGRACGPTHWHGYKGIEAQVVTAIGDWLSR